MNGIKGITGFNILAILLTLFFYESDLLFQEFIAISLISIIVFLLFNACKKARCFASDIGSISAALIIIFVLMHQILETGDYHIVFFLTIYGIENILTKSQRLVDGKIGDLFRLPLNTERLQKLTESYVVSNKKIVSAIGCDLPVSSKDGLMNTFKSFYKNAE